MPSWKPSGQADSDNRASKRQRVESIPLRGIAGSIPNMDNRFRSVRSNGGEASIARRRYRERNLSLYNMHRLSTLFYQHLPDNQELPLSVRHNIMSSNLRRSNAISFRNIRFNGNSSSLPVVTSFRRDPTARNERQDGNSNNNENTNDTNSNDTNGNNNTDQTTDANPNGPVSGRSLTSMLLSTFSNREFDNNVPFVPVSLFQRTHNDNLLPVSNSGNAQGSTDTTPEINTTAGEETNSNDTSNQSPDANTTNFGPNTIATVADIEPLKEIRTFYVAPSMRTPPGERHMLFNSADSTKAQKASQDIVTENAESSISKLNSIITQHSPFSLSSRMEPDHNDTFQNQLTSEQSNTSFSFLEAFNTLEDDPGEFLSGEFDLSEFNASHWSQLYSALEALENGASSIGNVCTMLRRFIEAFQTRENAHDRHQYVQIALRSASMNLSFHGWTQVIYSIINQLWWAHRHTFFPSRRRTWSREPASNTETNSTNNNDEESGELTNPTQVSTEALDSSPEGANTSSVNSVTHLIQRIINFANRNIQVVDETMSNLENLAEFTFPGRSRPNLDSRSSSISQRPIDLRFILTMRRRANSLLFKCVNRSAELRELLLELE